MAASKTSVKYSNIRFLGDVVKFADFYCPFTQTVNALEPIIWFSTWQSSSYIFVLDFSEPRPSTTQKRVAGCSKLKITYILDSILCTLSFKFRTMKATTVLQLLSVIRTGISLLLVIHKGPFDSQEFDRKYTRISQESTYFRVLQAIWFSSL